MPYIPTENIVTNKKNKSLLQEFRLISEEKRRCEFLLKLSTLILTPIRV